MKEIVEKAKTNNENPQINKHTSTERIQLIIFLGLMYLPLVLGGCLFLMNPHYLGQLIFSCASRGVPAEACSQPLGWMMLTVSILLIIVASLVLWGVRAAYPHKPSILLITGLICTFLLLPLILLVILFGPAVITLMETQFIGGR